MTERETSDVLVVGAGPTGLFMALLLVRLGVPVHVVDAADGAGATSCALAVQALTLELCRQVGVADEVVSRSRLSLAQSAYGAAASAQRASIFTLQARASVRFRLASSSRRTNTSGSSSRASKRRGRRPRRARHDHQEPR